VMGADCYVMRVSPHHGIGRNHVIPVDHQVTSADLHGWPHAIT
jgi:hypothetical protein